MSLAMSLSGDNILHYMWDIIKVYYVPLPSQSAAESWQAQANLAISNLGKRWIMLG
jgi:hypothetical protein